MMPGIRSAAKRALWCLACTLVLSTGQLHAEPSRELLDRQAFEVYQQVFSPFCPGRSLNDCPSSKAHELKLEIRRQLEQGLSPEVVLERVFQRFGDQYRAVPQYAGFGKLVWWVPLGFLLLGAVVALVIARGKRDERGVVSSARGHGDSVVAAEKDGKPLAPDTVSDELRQEIERELSRLD